MPTISNLQDKHFKFLQKHGLLKKWHKVKILLEGNLPHPSLNFEKIILKSNVIYSFRLDKKYRGICLLKNEGVIEIIAFTNHHK